MSYAMLLLERFHYMEKVPSTHLLYTKMQNLSEEWLSSAALVFERNVKIGAVVGAKHKFVNWWWTERLSWQKGRKMVWEGRRWHLNGNEFGRSEMLYKKSNEIGGEQLTVCRLSRKHSLGEAEILFICWMYCRSLFLQGNNSHGHYCEEMKTWARSESLGRCWCSSENKVNELQGQASRGMARFCWYTDHRKTEAQRELHPKVVCMGGPGKTAEQHSVVPGLNFLALWKMSDIWKEGNGLGKQTTSCHW